MTFEEALACIESATTRKDIFKGGSDEKTYKRLLKIIHPDRAPEKLRVRADAAARKLGGLFASTGISAEWTLGHWKIEKAPSYVGHLSKIYTARSEKHAGKVYLKIVNHAADNCFLEAEKEHIQKFVTSSAEFERYAPKFVEQFMVDKRQINVFEVDENMASLESIHKRIGKIPMRHVVWMGNRALAFLGALCRVGVVHGGMLPSHLLFDGKAHGMCVVGWGASKLSGHIQIVDPAYVDLYPKEVLRKRSAHPSTDIYMLMKALVAVGEPFPKEFANLVEFCLADGPHARPVDAWWVWDKWREIAELVYGKPKFVEANW